MAENSSSAPLSCTQADPWHCRSAAEAVELLQVDPATGLSSEQAVERQAAYGPNELRAADKTPAWRMFISQFNDFMIWVLFAAVAISAIEGQVPEAIAITAILILNGVLGFVQEYRAEQALDALKQMSAPVAKVLRDGAESSVPAVELVPGDIVVLEAGDKIPADGRLIKAGAMRVEEAALTGESAPVRKDERDLADADSALGDRVGMLFAGTSVAVGHGIYVVTSTGQHTEMGKIAELLAGQEDEDTPLQKELETVGKRIAIIVLVIAFIVFVEEMWRAVTGSQLPLHDAIAQHGFRDTATVALLVAISLAVAAIPEGLPAIVTVALSLGVRRMAGHNALVRKLHAVETLGSTTFICSDKTGTLTRNEMTVKRMMVGTDLVHLLPDFGMEPQDRDPSRSDRELLLEIASSCNDARFGAEGELLGDPTETALIVAADRIQHDNVRPRRIGEVPFDSERKRMTTVHAIEGSRVAYMKGGTDVVLSLCERALLRGEIVELTGELRDELQRANAELAGQGFRTLAFACRELAEGEPVEGEEIERAMVYVGILGLQDPPRPEVTAAIEECHKAGIHVAMVTGDHGLTAEAIGREIGLVSGQRVVTGVELEKMSDDELFDIVQDIRIYARVNPEHKLRIVDALKRHGEVVAMTGDGVNDAPALKRADIGVAMGRVGTDVSREAADMVLADDNFATIVEAVREGRVVFENLRKFILFLLSCNMSEVLIIFTTALLAPEPALLPLQILWINLVTDGLPALALGVDPGSPRVMDRAPRSADESILTKSRQLQVLWQGALITVGALAMYLGVEFGWFSVDSARHAQTMLFTTIVLAQLLHSFNFRSSTKSVFSIESFKNKWLLLAFGGSMALHSLVIYVPAMQRVFKTQPLGIHDWMAVVLAALIPIVLIDITKLAIARKNKAA
ncbi:MAG TPA: calcium-translocating P-type ATPase, PMCA-type [Coriobacteriia bacterium]|nr:calcium-translocating P-type ATPase, PMCA-type [Coriobacteriia bacterium]